MKQKNFLITGLPGSGKTTVITKLAGLLGNRACGFYTAEIRISGQRCGFEIVTLSGKKATLAHLDFSSKYRVGKYGVKPDNLREAIEEIYQAVAKKEPKCLLIDEIGKMELLATGFQEFILTVLNSPLPIVATIMAKPHPFCDLLKNRPDVRLFVINKENRDRLPGELYDLILPYL